MKLKILSIATAFILIHSMLVITPTTAQAAETSGTCGDNLTWILDDNGTLTISGTGEMEDWQYLSSPWYGDTGIKNVVIKSGVTSIGDQAFYGCTELQSISIPDSINKVGNSAFRGCAKLASVDLPAGIKAIEANVFYGCNSLTSISIPGSVSEIGNYAFKDCTKLESIFIPENVVKIGNAAFEGCVGITAFEVDDANQFYASAEGVLFNKWKTELLYYPVANARSSYTIPNSVTMIEGFAFSDCTNLMTVFIPDSVTMIEIGAFYHSASLTEFEVDQNNKNYASADGVLFNKEKTMLHQYPLGNARTHYTIPDGVALIDYGAFSNSANLESIFIPDSVLNIPQDVVMYFPALDGCEKLENIEVAVGNENYTSVDGVLFNKQKDEIILYPMGNQRTSYTIPDGVTRVLFGSFNNCKELRSITISDTVNDIDSGVFTGCTNLTNVSIGSGVDEITMYAFEGCTGLKHVSIPDNVLEISNGAFLNCTGLRAISIPDSVTSVNHSAFSGCTSLTDVYYSGSEAQWQTIEIDASNECLTNARIHYNARESYLRLSEANNAITVTAVDCGEVTDGTIVLAIYKNGVLEAVQTQPFAATVTFENLTLDGRTVKAMLWDSLDTMTPLAEAGTLTL